MYIMANHLKNKLFLLINFNDEIVKTQQNYIIKSKIK